MALEKKQLEIVIDTIQKATESNENKIFSAENKTPLIDFIKDNVQPQTDAMRILVDMVNQNYFDLFYNEKYGEAVKLAGSILKTHGAAKNKQEEFINTFFDFSTEEEEEMKDKEIIEEDKVETSEEIEESNSEEDDEEIEENEESPSVSQQKNVSNEGDKSNKLDKFLDGKKSFSIRMLLLLGLFIGALIAIRPTKVDLSKYTNTIISSYLDKNVILEVYITTYNESKESISEDDVEKLSKSISLQNIFKYVTDTQLKAFAKKNNISLDNKAREEQEKYIVKKLSYPNSFYIYYYVLFIIFSIGVIACCCIAQNDISLLWKFYKTFKASRGRKEDLKSKNKNINQICEAYTESFLLNETYNKTRSNADLYFGGETYFNDMNKLPIQAFLKIIPGTFIGFGILGTFIGFAGGLSSINIADSQSLLDGVQNLLDGLKNAFNTSIVGVLASMFLNFVMIHPLLNRLDRCSKQLCDYLDTKFFVSEVDAMSVTDANNKQIPFPQTMGIVLEKLEQVASNINQMGATVGDQVTQSVKATLDKTIEKIIKEEIKKLKEEMNSSIILLQECQKYLQNAPVHLKEAAEKMQAAAVNNDELFRRQNQESIEVLTKTIEENLNARFASYAKVVEETSEEMLNIKNTLALMPEDFSNIDKSIQTTTDKLSVNQTILENALNESTEAFDKTTKISESLTEAYKSQSKEIEEMISKFTDVLNEYKETSKESKELLAGFKGMDEQIAKIFERINENTKSYSEIIGNSLTNYLNSFTDATKDVSAKFADATDALREEVEKLNKSEKAKEDK